MAVLSTERGPDAESVYNELLDHARQCPTCRPLRDRLYRLDRLCGMGRDLVDAYAQAELAVRSPLGTTARAS